MVGQGQGITPLEDEDSEEAVSLSSGALSSGLSSGDLGGLGSLPPTSALAPAPSMAAVAVPQSDINFATWNIAMLCMIMLFMILCGMFAFDLVRNMWSWNGAYSVNSSLMDMILSWFEKIGARICGKWPRLA